MRRCELRRCPSTGSKRLELALLRPLNVLVLLTPPLWFVPGSLLFQSGFICLMRRIFPLPAPWSCSAGRLLFNLKCWKLRCLFYHPTCVNVVISWTHPPHFLSRPAGFELRLMAVWSRAGENAAHFLSLGGINRLALENFKRTLPKMRSRFACLFCRVFVQAAKIRTKSRRCSSIWMPSGTLRERPHRPAGQY